jgi:hypothetical protein
MVCLLLLLLPSAGTSALAASLSAQQSRLACLEAQLAQAEALGDDAERAALQKRVELLNRAGILPGAAASRRSAVRRGGGGGGVGFSGGVLKCVGGEAGTVIMCCLACAGR